MVAAIVLAASGGERFGGARALQRVDGELLLDRAMRAARESSCAPIVVVVGADAAQVRSQGHFDGVTVLDNSGWKSGSGSSLRLALETLAPADEVAAAVLLSVDTPGVTPAAVVRVCEDGAAKSLRTATYAGKRGFPVLLGRDHWAGVALLATGDVGARAYLLAHTQLLVCVGCDDIADGAEHPAPG